MTRQFILYFFLSIFFYSCKDDIQIFDKFDLASGQYKIVGLQTEGTPTKFVIDVGDFIISDKKTLSKIQDDWRIHLTDDRWACGTNYELYLLKTDTCVDILQINLECEFLTCKKGYFYFPADLLTKHEKSIQKISRDSALAFRDSLRTKRLFRQDVFK